MIYLDASALLALLLDEPAAPDVERMLREGDVSITSVNYAEVIDQATRIQKKGKAELARAIGCGLSQGTFRRSLSRRLVAVQTAVRTW